jgi:hypothetical protein
MQIWLRFSEYMVRTLAFVDFIGRQQIIIVLDSDPSIRFTDFSEMPTGEVAIGMPREL